MKQNPTFPLLVKQDGVSAKIRKIVKSKNGREYTAFVVDYVLLGKRKQDWRADLEEAKQAAREACRKIADGEHMALELKNGDRMTYLRATEALASVNMDLDTACREYAEAIQILSGRGSLVEAARFFAKTHNVELPAIDTGKAVEEMLAQSQADGKSQERLHQLRTYLDRFKDNFNGNVADITSATIQGFLTAMKCSERTKKNCRDVLRAFFKWSAMRGFLAKTAPDDLMEHVQTYRNKRIGKIEIFTPEEMSRLVEKAEARLLPYLVIGAFAGLRGEEIKRLDWSEIDLADGFIEVAADKAKTDTRRLVPIKDNLKAWLLPVAKEKGPVCAFKNVVNQLMQLATEAKVDWKKNALRHSFISYRVAECADVPRVADESGNSPAIIRTNYLQRVKPKQAQAWFGILPPKSA
jgi:integrase